MYFIKYQPLKDKLRTRSLSEREALPYFVIPLVCISAVSIPSDTTYNQWDWFSLGLEIVLTIGGTIYAYRENGGNEGFDFIQKYIVVGWVLTIRFILVVVPIGILFYVLGSMVGLKSWEETRIFDVVVIFFIQVIFYQRLARHISDTRGDNQETVLETAPSQ